MIKRYFLLFGLLLCGGVSVYAEPSPFVSSIDASDHGSRVSPHDFHVVGITVFGQRKIAVLKSSIEEFHIVEEGDKIGEASVSQITLDQVVLLNGTDNITLQVSN